nr:S-layer homology domain-containing protein [uncultured Tyzzerella sp.]
MKKKLLSSLLITLLFTSNVYAADAKVNININNNNADITLNSLDSNVHSLQLNITVENSNGNVDFEPAQKFNYIKKIQNGNTISILIDNGDSLTENGNLNVGTLKFTNTPTLSENVTLEVVDLDKSLQGTTTNIKANVKKDNTENNNSGNSSSNNSSSSSGSGANIGSSNNNTQNNNENTNKPENKPSGSIDINAMYPVVRQSNFGDTANHWANEPIKYLADRGIINGMNDTTFAPNNNITRAEFITLLAKMDNIDINKHKAENFTDVPSDAWFNPYVDWAAKNGITSGITANTFAPNDNITREQMAVMIERFANYKNFNLNNNKEKINFTDSANISSYASSSVAKVQQAGIINGRPDGSFAPKANATRGESAQMIYTMLTIQ